MDTENERKLENNLIITYENYLTLSISRYLKRNANFPVLNYFLMRHGEHKRKFFLPKIMSRLRHGCLICSILIYFNKF